MQESLPPTVNAWLLDALEGWRHLEKLGKRARKTRPVDAIRVIPGSPAETLLASSPEIAADFERAFDPPDRLDELKRQPSMLEAVQSPTKLAAWLERVWSALPDDASFHSTPGIDLLRAQFGGYAEAYDLGAAPTKTGREAALGDETR